MTAEEQAVPGAEGELLRELIEVMRQAHDLDLSRYDESFLASSFEKHRAAAGDSPAAHLARLSGERAEAESFAGSLLVTYSDFFRNPLTWALLEQQVLPALAEAADRSGRTELRIWSASCAAGQEAYSVAILLDELSRARERPIAFRIFATDLSESELAFARAGVFGAAAVRNLRLRHLDECFSRRDEFYSVAERIRDRVDFSLYDLLDAGTNCPPASIYGEFDLVFCSNVLLYYRGETQRFILSKVRQCLTARGYFVTGEAERQIAASAGGFRAVATPAAVLST